MGKKSSGKKKKQNLRKAKSATTFEAAASRNHGLDSLRGLAIVLMIVDHVAGILYGQNIGESWIRFVTRLSMPLFCLLTGYFVGGRVLALASSAKVKNAQSSKEPIKQVAYWQTVPWNRLGHVALAAAVLNYAYYQIYGQLEILCSLLVCYFLMYGLRSFFAISLLGFLLFQVESQQLVSPENGSRLLFDYPVSVVVSCAAVGFVVGRWDSKLAVLPAFAIPIVARQSWGDGMIVTLPSIYVLYFLVPAVVLLEASRCFPKCQMPFLAWIGRYPLRIYVAQYLIILLFAPG